MLFFRNAFDRKRRDVMNVQKYGRFEQSFNAKTSGNPFAEEFFAKVITPSGGEKKIRGFYDGEDTFRIRIMPEEIGKYSFVTESKHAELNGKRGEFTCIEAKEDNHGKVKVKDKYWFEYEDKTPYFEAGTTCYAWIYQTEELQKKTLETLSEGYFNKIRMCAFPKWYEHNRREPATYPFEGTLCNFDYSRPNVKLFRRLEEQIEKLGDMGIEADVILFHPYDKREWGFSNMPKECDEAYLKYIIARLSSYHNVWWSLANEFDIMRLGYKKKYNAWKKIAKLVHDEDPYGHLEGIHNCITMYDHKDPNITHCSVQKTELYRTVENTDALREKYGKPVVYDECSYEGNIDLTWGNISAEEMVRRFWEGTARGGYMGHGETYLDDENDLLWWSHGGTLHGESQKRIKFLIDTMKECDNLEFTYSSDSNNFAEGVAADDTFLTYFGIYQPKFMYMNYPKSSKYKVYAIDTWNMEKTLVAENVNGAVRVDLPGKPYCAVLAIATEKIDMSKTRFDGDTPFRDAVYYKGGNKFLKLFKLLMKVAGMSNFYNMALKLSLNQGAAYGYMEGIQRKGIEEGLSVMINDGKIFKGITIIVKAMKKTK